MKDYTYQDDLVARCWSHLQTDGRALLAATPGAGKTNMAIKVIETFVEHAPGKVLVLAHGQTTLRSQFFERIINIAPGLDPVEVTDGGVYERESRVYVAIPHTKNVGTGYGLIVVDEAHDFFTAKMVQAIVKKNPKAKLLLLTGSPFDFIRENQDAKRIVWPIVSAAADVLLERGVLCDLTVEAAQTGHDFTKDDYNEESELRKGYMFKSAQTVKTMDDLLGSLLYKLRSEGRIAAKKGVKTTLAKMVQGWGYLLNGLGKTMIVAHNQKQGQDIASYLRGKGVGVRLSTSDADSDSSEFDRFKENAEDLVLIVVRRGILGFDMPSLVNVIDLSGSLNPVRIQQLMCRVIRPYEVDGKPVEKLFLKVMPDALLPEMVLVMHFVVALGRTELFESFDGRWKQAQFAVPRALAEKKTREEVRAYLVKERGTEKDGAKPLLALPSMDFMNREYARGGEGLETTRHVRMSEVFGDWSGVVRHKDEDLRKEAQRRKDLGQGPHQWEKENGGEYNAARKRGIVKEVFGEPFKHKDEDLRKEAQRRKDLGQKVGQWRKENSGEYIAAHKRGIVREVFGGRFKHKHKDEELRAEAQRRKDLGQGPSQWKKENPGEYDSAYRRGITDEFFGEPFKHKDEDLRKEAQRRKDLGQGPHQWEKENGGEYNAARRRGIVREVFGGPFKHKDEDLRKEAQRRKDLGQGPYQWEKENTGEYKAAHRFGIIEEVWKTKQKKETNVRNIH